MFVTFLVFVNFSSDSQFLGFFRLDNICFVCLSTCISNPISFLSFSAVIVRAFVYTSWITSVHNPISVLAISAVTVRALVYTSWITSVLFAVCSQSHFCFSNFSSTCLGLCDLDNVCFICLPSLIAFLLYQYQQ